MNDAPRPSGDPFVAFREDHARVLERLASLEADVLAGGGPLNDAPLRELVAHLERQFATHMAAEDRVLFPALRAAFPEARGTIEPLVEDHAELRQMLSGLTGLLARSQDRARDEQLLVLARDLADLLRLHIRREESVVLDVASRVLSGAEIAAMAAGLETFRSADHDPRPPHGR